MFGAGTQVFITLLLGRLHRFENGYSNVAAVMVRNNQEPQPNPLLRKGINVRGFFFLAYSSDIQYKKSYLYAVKVVNIFSPIKSRFFPPTASHRLPKEKHLFSERGYKNNCSVLVTLVPYVEVILKSTFITLNLYGQPVLPRTQ